jgi:formate dehydrogenase major subunit
MAHKADRVLNIKSYYHFIKAVNYYLVANGFHNALYIKDNCEGFEEYKEELLKENFVELVEQAGAPKMDDIIEFAKHYNEEMNAVVVFSEKEISSNTSQALFNLAMITGKLGKTGSGIIALKEKNNSQGLFDMGVCMALGVGGVPVTNKALVAKMKKAWKVKELSSTVHTDIYEYLEDGCLKNLFIFGEDPLGCSYHKVQVAGWLGVADFVVVQDYFMTETANHADLVMPASFPLETGGSYTNTQKVIQQFEAHFTPKVQKTGLEQLADLLRAKGLEQRVVEPAEVLAEAHSLLITGKGQKLAFSYTHEDDENRLYKHGCDNIVKRFDEDFVEAFENAKIEAYEGI